MNPLVTSFLRNKPKAVHTMKTDKMEKIIEKR